MGGRRLLGAAESARHPSLMGFVSNRLMMSVVGVVVFINSTIVHRSTPDMWRTEAKEWSVTK